ncbi:MAG: tetratricopeptide repeat protein [Planctomycetota bacterium]
MRSLLMICLLALPLAADQIILKGGGRLSGEIVREQADSITLQLPAGSMSVPRARIEKIVREKKGAYLRREAEARLSSGLTATAVELCERALRDDPGNVEQLAGALVAHARASLAGFRLDRARRAVERLAEIAPDHSALAPLRAQVRAEQAKAEQLWRTAQSDFRNGRFSSGLEALHAWGLRQPASDPAVARELALAHEAAGAQAVRKVQLRTALDHFRAARSYGARGDVTRAIELLKPVAVLEALKEGREQEARRMIGSLATGYPSPGVARFLEAVWDQLHGEMPKAVAGYAEAQRLATASAGKRTGLTYDVVAAYARATLRNSITKPPKQGAKRWAETFLGPLASAESGNVTAYAPSEELAEQAANEADEQLRKVASELGLRIPRTLRAQVVVHPDKTVYVAADRNPGGTPLGGISVTREQTGGVTYNTLDGRGRSLIRVESFAGQKTLFTTVVPHEMVHVAQHLGFGAFRRAHWLDEGMAMLNESKAGRDQRLAWLQRSTQLFSLTELTTVRSTPPGQAFLFYNQAYAFTSYLRGLGTGQDWRAFLDRFATRNLDESVRETYGFESIDELERGFLSATGLKR